MPSLPTIRMRSAVLIVAAMIAAGAVALWLMGQPLICECGHIAIWSGNIASDQNSQQVADPYSLTHVTHGLLFFWALYGLRRRLDLSWRLVIAMGIEVAWEVVENTPMVINRYRETTISLGYFGDSVLNSTFDALCCVLGFAIASRISWRFAVALTLAVEVGLALTIRDSLLLNIIMLLFPNDTIRQWQAS